MKLWCRCRATAEKNEPARSYSEGIGIEVWLPTNGALERARACG